MGLDNDGVFDDATTPNARLIVPPNTLERGSFDFILTVTNDLGLTDTDQTTVMIRPAGGVRGGWGRERRRAY